MAKYNLQSQLWTLLNEAEIPEIPWHGVEEMIHRLREIEMLKWVCHVQPPHLAPNSVLQRTQKTLVFTEKYIGEVTLGKHYSELMSFLS